MTPRDRIAAAAVAELGNADPSKYWLDVLRPPVAHPQDAKGIPLSWCGAFALWCLHQAEAAPLMKWLPGSGFLYRLRRTSDPKVGDIAYRDKPFQHHAVIVGIDSNTIDTVDGNADGGRVVQHNGSAKASWTAFFSVESVLPKARTP